MVLSYRNTGIISIVDQMYFLGNNHTILSMNEIENTQKFLEIQFICKSPVESISIHSITTTMTNLQKKQKSTNIRCKQID